MREIPRKKISLTVQKGSESRLLLVRTCKLTVGAARASLTDPDRIRSQSVITAELLPVLVKFVGRFVERIDSDRDCLFSAAKVDRLDNKCRQHTESVREACSPTETDLLKPKPSRCHRSFPFKRLLARRMEEEAARQNCSRFNNFLIRKKR